MGGERMRMGAPAAGRRDPGPETGEGLVARPVTPADVERLAVLMLDAYAGTPDADGSETLDDARSEIRATFDGDYGTFDAEASEVVVAPDGSAAAATLVTRYEDVPFVSFSMTAGAWKRRGLARRGLLRAMARLAGRGERRVELVVTRANDPAVALYRALGFTEAD